MARFKALSVALARAADGKKGEEVALLHVAKTSPVSDYLLIVTANSRPHLETLEWELAKAAKEFGCPALRSSKPRSDAWRVLDFGGLLAHLMTAEARTFYALERLHEGAPRVDWRTGAAPAGHARRRTKAHA